MSLYTAATLKGKDQLKESLLTDKGGLIYTITEQCIGCNRCISACPVPTANIAKVYNGRNVVEINPDACIHCGRCLDICRHNVRQFIDDTERFFEDLKNRVPISLVVAPSIRTNFPNNYKNLFGYFKSIGVNLIYDTSFGAEITTWAYLKYIKDNNVSGLISQPCPAIVNYIEKYQPELFGKLAPVHSPMMCTAVYMKEYAKVSDRLAFISPCIAKKDEVDSPATQKIAAYNVTYSKLSEYLKENNIDLNRYPEINFDDMGYNFGSLFPRPGGLRENVEYHVKEAWVRQVEGQDEAYDYLNTYHQRIKENKPLPTLVDILNCRHGCNFGTGTLHEHRMDDADWIMHKEKQQGKKTSQSFWNRSYRLFAYFDKNLDDAKFRRSYMNQKVELSYPTKAEINEMFRRLLKEDVADQHMDCSACGYDSCEKMAVALLRDVNSLNNCVDYNRKQLSDKNDFLEQKVKELSTQVFGVADNVSDCNQSVLTVVGAMQEMVVNIKNISVAAGNVALNSDQAKNLADEMATSIEHVNRSASQAVDSTTEVATAISEINISLTDVSRNCDTSMQMNRHAEVQAQENADIITRLSGHSKKINQIVSMISTIAQQTNMLALNATIEAASAGEVGKGFAVVASEVKELAKKTALATSDIAEQIDTMRHDIGEAVQSTAKVREVIKETSKKNMAIAAAVTEQSAIMGGIATAITKVNDEIYNITSDIGKVAGNVSKVADNIAEVQDMAGQAARATEELIATSQKVSSSASTVSAKLGDVVVIAVEVAEDVRQLSRNSSTVN